MITVVITCYKKFDYFNRVLNAWLRESLVDEILVVDNSGGFKTEIEGVKVVSLSENMGTQVKYPMALLAKNRWVIYADDDVLAIAGLAMDLYNHKVAMGAVGIIGRIFSGKSYYTSEGIRGKDISVKKRVDWLGGGCTLTERLAGGIEIAKCPANEIDDWWWEREMRLTGLFVVPTKKYEFLDPSEGIHTTEKCKEWRERFYAKTQSR